MDIGVKYQFITLHNNTNSPCRLKKKRKRGFLKKCQIAIHQVMWRPYRRGQRKPQRVNKSALYCYKTGHTAQNIEIQHKSYTHKKKKKRNKLQYTFVQ